MVERIFADLGRAARVEILRDPHLSGAPQALDGAVVAGIVADNPMIELFLLVVDNDCDREGNRGKAATREAEHSGRLIACLAMEEVEVWMLALHRDELDESWATIRAECDPKERYADPFLEAKGWSDLVGHGRKRAMRHLGKGWTGLLSVCPEVREFKERIERWVGRVS